MKGSKEKKEEPTREGETGRNEDIITKKGRQNTSPDGNERHKKKKRERGKQSHINMSKAQRDIDLRKMREPKKAKLKDMNEEQREVILER